jgi:hypothetical protein
VILAQATDKPAYPTVMNPQRLAAGSLVSTRNNNFSIRGNSYIDPLELSLDPPCLHRLQQVQLKLDAGLKRLANVPVEMDGR